MERNDTIIMFISKHESGFQCGLFLCIQDIIIVLCHIVSHYLKYTKFANRRRPFKHEKNIESIESPPLIKCYIISILYLTIFCWYWTYFEEREFNVYRSFCYVVSLRIHPVIKCVLSKFGRFKRLAPQDLFVLFVALVKKWT